MSDALDDAQARLRIERIEQRRPCRRAAVALLVDIWSPQREATCTATPTQSIP